MKANNITIIPHWKTKHNKGIFFIHKYFGQVRPILFESQSTQEKTGSMNGETNLIVNANKFKLENEFWIILQYTVHMDINDAYVTPPLPQ